MTDAGSRVYDGNAVSGPSSCEEPCAEGADWTRVGATCYLLSPNKMGWHAAQQVATSNVTLNIYTLYVHFMYSVLFHKWRPSSGNIVTKARRHS